MVVIGPLESIKGGSISISGGLLSSTPPDGVVEAGVVSVPEEPADGVAGVAGVAAPVDPVPDGG